MTEFVDVFGGSDNALIGNLLMLCGPDLINMRATCMWFRDVLRTCEKTDAQFWQRVNDMTWILSWKLYNPHMTTTFVGFTAICRCWRALETRVADAKIAGLDVSFVRDSESGIPGVCINLGLDSLHGNSIMAMPVIRRGDRRKWRVIDNARAHVVRMRLTREELMFLQPEAVREFDFAPPNLEVDSREVIDNKHSAFQFISYRLCSKINMTKLCPCGACSVDGVGDLVEVIEQMGQAQEIMDEKGVLEFQDQIVFTNFQDYGTSDNGLRADIFIYYMRYIFNSRGEFPDKRAVAFLQTVILSVIDYNRVKRLTNDIYELLAQFRHKLGPPERWDKFIAGGETKAMKYITKWFQTYSDDKKW